MHTADYLRSQAIEHKTGKDALIISGLLLALTLAAQLLPETAQLTLRYQRSAIENSELWRLFSAHLLHLSWVHLALNALALVLLALLFERFWLACDLWQGGLFVALGIGLALYCLYPNIHWYVGLSGVLHGWFVIASLRMALARQLTAWFLLAAITAKIGYEAFWETTNNEEMLGGQVIEEAHLWGALAGLVYFALRSAIELIGRRQKRAL